MQDCFFYEEGYKKYVRFAQNKDFKLESGKYFGPIDVAYETYGTINDKKNNIILITHALTGDSHVAKHSEEDEKLGWWDKFVGPGKIFDTNKYFIICSNVLGGCQGTTGPSSISEDGKPYGIRFPIITIKDMVNVQKKLLDCLNIEHIHCVVGGSMGGMQALEWAVSYPDFMDGVINIASPLRLNPQSIAFNEVMRRAIMSDPNWKNGDYYGDDIPQNGLSIARMIGMITYQSDVLMEKKFNRRTKDPIETFFDSFNTEFEVESYLHYQGLKLVQRFDANTYLYLTRAMDLFDFEREYGSIENALKRIKAKFLLVAITSDILFPLSQMRQTRDELLKYGVKLYYNEIESDYGHDSFLVEDNKFRPILSDFLDELDK
ncbi:homoserine O-acetyltransferase [Caldicellulosiruptoraceae bacterium PP1]